MFQEKTNYGLILVNYMNAFMSLLKYEQIRKFKHAHVNVFIAFFQENIYLKRGKKLQKF